MYIMQSYLGLNMMFYLGKLLLVILVLGKELEATKSKRDVSVLYTYTNIKGERHVSMTNTVSKHDEEQQVFANRKSDLCPNGVVYREACGICYCIETSEGLVRTKCEYKYSDEECDAVKLRPHCLPDKLLFDYKKECEGVCKCNKAMNMTICETLPCDNDLLWYHGLYNEDNLFTNDKNNNNNENAETDKDNNDNSESEKDNNSNNAETEKDNNNNNAETEKDNNENTETEKDNNDNSETEKDNNSNNAETEKENNKSEAEKDNNGNSETEKVNNLYEIDNDNNNKNAETKKDNNNSETEKDNNNNNNYKNSTDVKNNIEMKRIRRDYPKRYKKNKKHTGKHRYPNRRTDNCPNGAIYREGCRLCFCIEDSGDVSTKCVAGVPEDQCANVSQTAHCDEDKLLFDYREDCEGKCVCNKYKNVTICESLPCKDNLFWYHGYYKKPVLKHKKRQVVPAVRSQSVDLTSGHPNKRTDLCPYGVVYRESCKMCYCIVEIQEFVRIRCEDKFINRECEVEPERIHCNTEELRLRYNYNKECEGECECIEEKPTITICEKLPCNDSLLWFHGFYNNPDYGSKATNGPGEYTTTENPLRTSTDENTNNDLETTTENEGLTNTDESTNTDLATEASPEESEGTTVSRKKEKRKYPNVRTEVCPYGTVYRATCKLCYCIDLHDSLVRVRCESNIPEEDCEETGKRSHCDTFRLLYDYNEECEGKCECNDLKNLTICEYLPCNNSLLWFHDMYEPPDEDGEDTNEPTTNEESTPWFSPTNAEGSDDTSDEPNSSGDEQTRGNPEPSGEESSTDSHEWTVSQDEVTTEDIWGLTVPTEGSTSNGGGGGGDGGGGDGTTQATSIWTGIHIVMRIDGDKFLLHQEKPKKDSNEISFHVIPKGCDKNNEKKREVTAPTNQSRKDACDLGSNLCTANP